MTSTRYPSNSKSILEKLARVQHAISALEKRHEATKLGYKYRSIEDVMNEIHDLFAKERVLLVPTQITPSILGSITRIKEGNRYEIPILSLTITADLIDAEDGSKITVQALGTAIMDDDKAAGKATSYGMKYLLTLLTTCPYEDMPDTDKFPEDKTPQPPTPHRQEPVKIVAPPVVGQKSNGSTPEAAKPLTEAERSIIISVLQNSGVDMDEVIKTYGQPSEWTDATRQAIRDMLKDRKHSRTTTSDS